MPGSLLTTGRCRVWWSAGNTVLTIRTACNAFAEQLFNQKNYNNGQTGSDQATFNNLVLGTLYNVLCLTIFIQNSVISYKFQRVVDLRLIYF